MRGLVKWILSVFSEETGNGSESRVSSYTVIAGSLLLVFAVTMVPVFRPSVKSLDIPPGAQVILLALIAAAVGKYGINKFTTPASISTQQIAQTPPQTTGEPS